MKHISLFTIISFTTLSCFGAAEFDLRKGIDLSATNRPTGTQLNQLVDSGTISATNKGGIIKRSGLGGAYFPDTSLNPRYTNFLWIDTFVSPGTLKSYVPTGHNYTNWVNASVAVGSITGDQIANYSIGDLKLGTNSVNDYAIKASAVSGNKIADNGIIAGKLSANAVIQGNVAFGAIVGGQITNNTITYTNIALGTLTRELFGSSVISSGQITNGGVTTANIALTNIDATLIRNDGVVTAAITNGAVTTNKLAGDINRGLLNTNLSYVIPSTWGNISGTTVRGGHNVSSVVNGTAGRYNIIFITPYTDTNYVISATAFDSSGNNRICTWESNALGSVTIDIRTGAGALTAENFMFSIIGK